MSLGSYGLPPVRSLATAAAQTLAWALAEKADFGMAPAIEASPMTWMLGCSLDSNVAGSIGHQPLRSAAPALSAMRPAFCGGVTLAPPGLCPPETGAPGHLPSPRPVSAPPPPS